MSERFTVAFDEPGLYRRLKVRAAEEGIPMKTMIQDAIRVYLDARVSSPRTPAAGDVLDWDRWDRFQQELDDIAEGPGSKDASDIKHQLYAYPSRELTEEGWRSVADGPASYDAG